MRIIAFLNAYTSGKSGGDMRAIEILKRRPAGSELVIVTSSAGRALCESEGLAADFRITTHEQVFGNVILTYLQRILRGLAFSAGPLGKALPGTVIYSTSDAWPDVLPALLILLRSRGAYWLCPMYHLITSMAGRPGGYSLTNLLSYATQKVSLFLIRRGGALVDTETSFNRTALVASYGFAPEKVLVAASGIDPSRLDATPTAGEKKYDFCYLARLHRSKGIFDLIQAWRLVCDRQPEARLGIGGGGAAAVVAELAALISELRLEKNIELLGFLSDTEKYRLFKTSRAYVLPSYEEGIPITFYEAMAASLPVVTYYLPTYCDIKEGIFGVPVGDIARLAETLLAVLDGKIGTAELISRNREKVRAVNTWENVAGGFWSRLDGR